MNGTAQNITSPEKQPRNSRFEPQEAGPLLVYFAAKRTLLNWVCAALGLMAFGFVVDRFGLVLRHFSPDAGALLYPKSFSLWAGAAQVIGGAVMNVGAAFRYIRFMHRYRRAGSTEPGRFLYFFPRRSGQRHCGVFDSHA